MAGSARAAPSPVSLRATPSFAKLLCSTPLPTSLSATLARTPSPAQLVAKSGDNRSVDDRSVANRWVSASTTRSARGTPSPVPLGGTPLSKLVASTPSPVPLRTTLLLRGSLLPNCTPLPDSLRGAPPSVPLCGPPSLRASPLPSGSALPDGSTLPSSLRGTPSPKRSLPSPVSTTSDGSLGGELSDTKLSDNLRRGGEPCAVACHDVLAFANALSWSAREGARVGSGREGRTQGRGRACQGWQRWQR